MIIGRLFYPVTVLGYGKRVGIWTCGCNRKCKNCASPELQIATNGTDITIAKIMQWIRKFEKSMDGVTISGGEPFDQSKELAALVRCCLQEGIDDILIFTGYTIDQLREKRDINIDYSIENVAAIIDGEYREKLNTGIGLRGSQNQRLIVNRYKERYKDCFKDERRLQGIIQDDKVIFIGIP